jgi:hypothetical protein
MISTTMYQLQIRKAIEFIREKYSIDDPYNVVIYDSYMAMEFGCRFVFDDKISEGTRCGVDINYLVFENEHDELMFIMRWL